MKKQLPIYLCSATIIFEGIFLLFTNQYTFDVIKPVTVTALILGAILSFLSTLFRQRKQVAYIYLEMHALAMLVYGLALFVFCDDTESFILLTSFLFFFYAFSEIIFCSWLFNLGRKVVFKIIFLRLFLALSVGIGVVLLVSYPYFDTANKLQGFGILFVITGINIFLYLPVMRTLKKRRSLFIKR